jgi:hypothetical protein
VHGVPGMLGPYFDEQIPVLGELPDRLDIVGQERWRSSQEPLIPSRSYQAVATA